MLAVCMHSVIMHTCRQQQEAAADRASQLKVAYGDASKRKEQVTKAGAEGNVYVHVCETDETGSVSSLLPAQEASSLFERCHL